MLHSLNLFSISAKIAPFLTLFIFATFFEVAARAAEARVKNEIKTFLITEQILWRGAHPLLTSVTRRLDYFLLWAIYSNENEPNGIRNLQKWVKSFAQYQIDPLPIVKVIQKFAKVVKFRPI